MSLGLYSRRATFSRPGRTILTIASAVIGVASIVSVSVVTKSTRESYQLLFAAARGNTSLEIASASSANIPESLVEQAAAVPKVKAAVPVVQVLTAMTVGENRIRVQILGIDPERDHFVREMAVVEGRSLDAKDKDKLLIERSFAEQLGVGVNDVVRVLTKKRFKGEGFGPVEMEIVGLIEFGGGAISQMGVVFMPIARCQSRFGLKGEITKVQVVADKGADVEAIRAAIQSGLREGVEAKPARESTLLEGTLKSFDAGLLLSTAFSLLLAGFIILNTFLMNLGERRRQLAVLRVIGATRRQMISMVLWESLALGLIGTAVGIVVGLLSAWAITDTLATVLDVPLPSATQFMSSPMPYVMGVLFGLVLSISGALLPAVRAGRVSPLEGTSRVAQSDLDKPSRRFLIVGVILIVVSSVLIGIGVAGYLALNIPIFASVGLYTGFVLLFPHALKTLARPIAAMVRSLFRIESDLALRQILRNRSRSALTAGVLFIAGSTGLGMAHSILDNVGDVKDWYRRSVVGDFYIRAMLPDLSSGMSPDLPDELEPDLRQAPGIAYLDRTKMFEVRIRGVSADGAAAGEDLPAIAIAREHTEPGKPPIDLVTGDLDTLLERFKAGEVVLGSVLAQKMGLGVGDMLEISTPEGAQRMRICGTYNEYLVGGESVGLDWEVAERLFRVEGVDCFIIRAQEGQLQTLEKDLLAISKKHGVLLHSAAEIGERIDRIVQGINAGLWALIGLGSVVASFGVANTLFMNVLEQTRELGLMRIIGTTRPQVRRTILAQAVIIGGVGLIPGLLLGSLVAWIMNLSTNNTLGRTIELGFHPWLMVSAVAVAVFIVLGASFIPARRASRLDIVEALHYE